ncbi:MAG: hypothetical protein ABJA98_27545 [Acidobacteriota bacterium]
MRARNRYNPHSFLRSHLPRNFGTFPMFPPKPAAWATTRRGVIMASCPECDADIEVDEFDVDKGDQISCPECGTNLEVTGLSPIELDISPDDDDDEDDDDDDDDEEAVVDDEVEVDEVEKDEKDEDWDE